MGPILDRAEAALGAAIDWAAAGPWRTAILVIAVGLVLVLPGLGAMPVTDRDEGRFVQASKQMLETGDLVDIRFQDRPRWKKPAGIYWMQAGSASLFGGTDAPIWAYRLPSVLGVLGAALALAWAVRPLVGARAAVLAALMLPATVLSLAEATIAKTDAMLLLTAVVVLGGVARLIPPDVPAVPGGPPPMAGPRAPAEDRGSLPWGTALAVWLAVAAAILLKGPIVPVIGLLALAWLWAVRRRVPPLARLRPLPGLLLVALLVAPWLAAIWAVSEGGFFAESVGRDLLGKVAEGQEKHWGPPGLYLALVWVTFWPWAALIPPALPWLWERRRSLWLLVLAGWAIPFWIVLEAVPTKLPHYVLPLYPALAALLAVWALAGDRGTPRRWVARTSAGLAAVPGVVLALAMIALPLALEGRVVWAAVPFAAVAALASVAAARAALDLRPLAQIGTSLVASAAVAIGVLQFGLPALKTVFPSARMAELAEPWLPCASGPLITAGYREPSLVFETETGTRLASPPEAARALARDPGALVLLEDRWRPLLERTWNGPGPELVERGEISYFNYNRGNFETARLVTRDDPRWAACAP